MPRLAHYALSPARVRQEKRPGRYGDGNGLTLHVAPTGSKFWLWRGTVNGERRVIGIGPVRFHTLAEARDIAIDWSRLARAGQDPRQVRDAASAKRMTFEQAARLVHRDKVVPTVTPKAGKAWLAQMERYVFPTIGQRPVAAITSGHVAGVLDPMWPTVPTLARRQRQAMARVFDWAIERNHRDAANPVTAVRSDMKHHREEHRAALDWQELPGVVRRLDEADLHLASRALRFLILTAARSAEARGMTWSEIDREAARWTVPAARMKSRKAHVVPLSAAALALLGKPGRPGDLVFPGLRAGRPLSDKVFLTLLRDALPAGHDATAHGMRTAFRGWAAEETNFPREVAEAALAHSIAETATEAAYLRSDLYKRRVALMDGWARFLTGAGADVVRLAHA